MMITVGFSLVAIQAAQISSSLIVALWHGLTPQVMGKIMELVRSSQG
jgi:hypothetical protein